jgi:transposase
MTKRKNTDYNISAEEFVVAWQTSKSAQEVADRLGVPKPIVHARASAYQQAGIKLKHMPKGPRKRLDLEELNRLAEAALANATQEAQPPAANEKRDLAPKDAKEAEARMRELLARKEDVAD